jgi:hypothetical protein
MRPGAPATTDRGRLVFHFHIGLPHLSIWWPQAGHLQPPSSCCCMDVARWAIGTLAPHLRQVTIAHLFRVRLPKISTTIDKPPAAMNMRAAMVVASIGEDGTPNHFSAATKRTLIDRMKPSFCVPPGLAGPLELQAPAAGCRAAAGVASAAGWSNANRRLANGRWPTCCRHVGACPTH